MSEQDILYEKIVYENDDKGLQLRVVVNVFREIEYFHLRKYFLSFEGEWVPTKEGVSFPMSIQNIYAVLDALIEICSKSESVDAIATHLTSYISDLKQNTD